MTAYEERTQKISEKVKSSRAKDKMQVDQTIDTVTLTSMFQDSMDMIIKEHPAPASGSSSGYRAHMFTMQDEQSSDEHVCIDKPVSTSVNDETIPEEREEKYSENLKLSPRIA